MSEWIYIESLDMFVNLSIVDSIRIDDGFEAIIWINGNEENSIRVTDNNDICKLKKKMLSKV